MSDWDSDMPTAEEDGLPEDEGNLHDLGDDHEVPVVKSVSLPGSAPVPVERVYKPGEVVPHASRVADGALAADAVWLDEAPGIPTPTKWRCVDCGVTWTTKPAGEFHSHEHPVAGSKSRVTYTNHKIEAVTA